MFGLRRGAPPDTTAIMAAINEALLSELDPRLVLRNLLSTITEVLKAERAAIFLYHADEDDLRGEVASGRGKHYTVSTIALALAHPGAVQNAFFAPAKGVVSKSETLLPIIARTAPAGGNPLCWTNPEQLCNLQRRTSTAQRAQICPACSHFGALGVLSIEGTLSNSTSEMLPVLARSTALAIRNARMYEEMAESRRHLSWHSHELEQVGELSRQLVRELEVSSILKTLAVQLQRAFGFTRVTVALNQKGMLSGYLTVKGGKAYWTQQHTQLRIPIATSSDPFAEAARRRIPLLASKQDLPNGAESFSMGIVPILAYSPPQAKVQGPIEELFGVVAVDYYEHQRVVSPEELNYVSLLVNTAAVAIRNAQAFGEKTRLLQALQTERGKLAQAIEEMGDGLVVLEGFRGFANRQAREILGIGEQVTLDRLPSYLSQALEGRLVELEITSSAGQQRFFSALGTKQANLTVLVLHEITQRKQAEDALKSSEAKNRAILEAIPDMLFVLSPVGVVLEYKPASVNPLPLPPDQIQGHSIAQLLEPDTANKLTAALHEALGGKTPFVDFQLKLADRLHDFEGQAVAFAKQQVLFVVRDVTNQKDIERMKSEFIAAVSHELRTPLAAIMGFTELLLGENINGEERQEFLRIIYDNGIRLKNMVDNLLDTSRLEAGRFEVYRRPTNLSESLQHISQSFQGIAQLSGVQFHTQIDPLPLIEADPERIAQVVGNLLSNAFKFTPRGGEIHLIARNQPKQILIEVRDTGSGIAPEELSRLFIRYGRARNAADRGVAGTGLGLYISKAIVEAHGGQIWVESRVGEGASFCLVLPKTAQAKIEVRPS